MEQTTVLPKDIERFINAFRSIGKGALSEQAARDMQKAIKATMIEGKKSTVTIKLDIKRSSEDMITIDGESKATIPTTKISGAFFVDREFLPTRNRPEQLVMKFD